MVRTPWKVEVFEGFDWVEGVESFEESDGADSFDIAAVYIYCHRVRTPWE